MSSVVSLFGLVSAAFVSEVNILPRLSTGKDFAALRMWSGFVSGLARRVGSGLAFVCPRLCPGQKLAGLERALW